MILAGFKSGDYSGDYSGCIVIVISLELY